MDIHMREIADWEIKIRRAKVACETSCRVHEQVIGEERQLSSLGRFESNRWS